MAELHGYALAVLRCCDPDEKCRLTSEGLSAFQAGNLQANAATAPAVEAILEPGRPARPALVQPAKVPKRGYVKTAERIALIHSMTHIEFNAVNLGWDAVYRYHGMPDEYYADWLGVAADEAKHFMLLRERLRALGGDYGDCNAHNGLWDMAVKTADDFAARMALVPRVLEARSLDAVPGICRKLISSGDPETADVLRLIEREEVPHVLVGTRWFHQACAENGWDPVKRFFHYMQIHNAPYPRGWMNREARAAAGFTEFELDTLASG